MKIAGISGSLRMGSFNSALLHAAQKLAPDGMAIEIEEIADIPLYNADVQADGFPGPVQRLIDSLRAADGVLIATPEYNYSIPGVLKNAIDWVSRADDQPFAGMPVAIMGASPGNLGTARAQYHLRQVFVFLDGIVMNKPEVFVGAAHSKHDDKGNLVHQDTEAHLTGYLSAFKDWVEKVGGA
ncbi:MAG: NAD(P)H-dependent oxidoreductase [Alphaproteobacteria bacterium]|nr:NAD(P)H-dependent oxidoreductase [Alphaproteobacteria bacterium]